MISIFRKRMVRNPTNSSASIEHSFRKWYVLIIPEIPITYKKKEKKSLNKWFARININLQILPSVKSNDEFLLILSLRATRKPKYCNRATIIKGGGSQRFWTLGISISPKKDNKETVKNFFLLLQFSSIIFIHMYIYYTQKGTSILDVE